MTPTEIELVRSSWQGADTTAVVERFYDTLFAIDPTVESLFLGEPTLQRVKFDDTLTAIIDALEEPTGVARRVRQLGERHAAYGVLPRHYALVEEALIAALGDTLGNRFDVPTERAWRKAYHALADGMMDAALDPVTSPGVG